MVLCSGMVRWCCTFVGRWSGLMHAADMSGYLGVQRVVLWVAVEVIALPGNEDSCCAQQTANRGRPFMAYHGGLLMLHLFQEIRILAQFSDLPY
jgi:hypothetical protein